MSQAKTPSPVVKGNKVSFKLQTIRQAELVKDDSRLYVLNLAKPVGNINFNVTDSAGSRQPMVIPQSPCPVDLSNYAERASILRESTFRRLVASGSVALVDNDQAEEFCTTDKRGIRETKRILKNIGITDPLTDGGSIEVELGAPSEARSESERVGAGAENPFIENLVIRSKNEEEDSGDLMSDLESNAANLTAADLEYVVNFAGNADLKEFAADMLNEMRG